MFELRFFVTAFFMTYWPTPRELLVQTKKILIPLYQSQTTNTITLPIVDRMGSIIHRDFVIEDLVILVNCNRKTNKLVELQLLASPMSLATESWTLLPLLLKSARFL